MINQSCIPSYNPFYMLDLVFQYFTEDIYTYIHTGLQFSGDVFGFCHRVMLASQNELGSVLSSSVFFGRGCEELELILL